MNIYFENAESAITPDTLCSVLDLRKRELALKAFVVLKQIHGNNGLLIGSQEQAMQVVPRTYEGDYLITSIKNVGLGVLTADCLPIIIYDKKTESIGIAHAGWRGSVQRIGITMLEHMMQAFGTEKESVQIFLGPSAGACCYEVQESFFHNLEVFSYGLQAIVNNNNAFYFDLALFNQLQFIDFGIKQEQIDSSCNKCTIENKSFCSYRRDAGSPLRQLSFVFIE